MIPSSSDPSEVKQIPEKVHNAIEWPEMERMMRSGQLMYIPSHQVTENGRPVFRPECYVLRQNCTCEPHSVVCSELPYVCSHSASTNNKPEQAGWRKWELAVLGTAAVAIGAKIPSLVPLILAMLMTYTVLLDFSPSYMRCAVIFATLGIGIVAGVAMAVSAGENSKCSSLTRPLLKLGWFSS